MISPKISQFLTSIGSKFALSALIAGASTLVHAANPALTARVIVQYASTDKLISPAIQPGPLGSAPNQARMKILSLRTGLLLQSARHISPDMHVVVSQGLTSTQLAQQLSRQPGVAFAVEDRRVKMAAIPNDPFYPQVAEDGKTNGPVVGQWYLKPPNSIFSASINAEKAWDFTSGHPGVVVAVLDTGIRADHPDLESNVLPGYDFVTNDVMGADQMAGRDADPSDPGDWVTDTEAAQIPGCNPWPNSSWHGTQVAGLISAKTNNGIGMASVGRTVSILPVRVLGKCGGLDSDVIAAMRWAAGLTVPEVPPNPKPAKVLNLSLGGTGACGAAYESVLNEIHPLGVVVVAAAGNSGGQSVGVPANCPGTIAVSAVNHSGTKTSYSDIGPEATISAPGGNCHNDPEKACLFPILSTTNLGTTVPTDYSDPNGIYYTDSGFNAGTGTSFATPLVAGTVALMLSVNPNLSPTEIRTLIQKTARPFPFLAWDASDIPECTVPDKTLPYQIKQGVCYCTSSTCGAGLLDTGAAVQLVSKGVQPQILLSPGLPRAGEALGLSANASVLPLGKTIVAYHWSLVDGGGIVNQFAAGADTATASLTPSNPGRFAVRLTMTDEANEKYTLTQSFDVAASQPPAPALEPVQHSTGGGSMSILGLLGLLVAIGILRASRRG